MWGWEAGAKAMREGCPVQGDGIVCSLWQNTVGLRKWEGQRGEERMQEMAACGVWHHITS